MAMLIEGTLASPVLAWVLGFGAAGFAGGSVVSGWRAGGGAAMKRRASAANEEAARTRGEACIKESPGKREGRKGRGSEGRSERGRRREEGRSPTTSSWVRPRSAKARPLQPKNVRT